MNLSNFTPLSHEDAIKALKAGEILYSESKKYADTTYHYYKGNILKHDSYFELGEGEVIKEDELPQIYRFNEHVSTDDIPDEIDENYITISFNDDGTLSATSYWESKLCKEGYHYLVHHHSGVYSLLLPDDKEFDDGVALSIYITRGAYKGIEDCLEIVFDNGSNNPLRIFLHHSQVFGFKNMELGWKGQLYIYSAYSKLDSFYYFI